MYVDRKNREWFWVLFGLGSVFCTRGMSSWLTRKTKKATPVSDPGWFCEPHRESTHQGRNGGMRSTGQRGDGREFQVIGQISQRQISPFPSCYPHSLQIVFPAFLTPVACVDSFVLPGGQWGNGNPRKSLFRLQEKMRGRKQHRNYPILSLLPRP